MHLDLKFKWQGLEQNSRLRDIYKKGTDGQYELTWSTWIFGALSSTLKSFVCNGALHVSLQHLQWILSPLVRFFWYLYPSNTSTFPPLSPLVTYAMSDSFWHFSGCGGRKRSCKIFPSSLTTQKTQCIRWDLGCQFFFYMLPHWSFLGKFA